MNFGYLIFVNENEKIDYLKLAYLLAMSIKLTQKEGYDRVALVTNNKKKVLKLKSPWVFDEVIDFERKEDGWNPRSWMDRYTPFEYTVCLDSDMIFFRDYSHWIEPLIKSNMDLFLPNRAYTYRGEIVTNNYYRKTFTENSLPNLYSFYTFFKTKTETIKDFFNISRWIINNPNEFKHEFLSKKPPNVVGTDESFALAAKILDMDSSITLDTDLIKIVHLKPMIQNWPWPTEEVFDHVGFYFDLDGQLKIGNYQQLNILHYYKKEIITDEIISIVENKIWKK
jgi:hypothetical protein